MAVVQKLFVEKFAPKSLKNFVLPTRIRELFKNDADPLSQSMLFYGLQGSGKSSLAKLIGSRYIFKYVNGSTNGSIDTLRGEIEEFCEQYQIIIDPNIINKKVVLFDEINGASTAFFEGLKGFMDSYPTVLFLATTNHYSKIPDPIKSRMLCVNFSPLNAQEQDEVISGYTNRVTAILTALKFNYDGDGLHHLIQTCYPDFRKTLNLLQSLYASGVTTITNDTVLQSAYQYQELYAMMLTTTANTPHLIHTTISAEYGSNAGIIMTSFTTEFVEYILAHGRSIDNIPTINIIVADHLHKLNNSVDPVITLKSCIYSIIKHLK